jgi:hypothetical protein
MLSWIRRHLELTPVGHAYSPNWPELGCRSPCSTIRALAAIC